MTDPKLNLRPLDSAPAVEPAPSGRAALWGVVVAALIVAALAIGLVWGRGDLFDLAPGAARMRVVIVIVVALIVFVAIHLCLFFVGAYAVAGQMFRRETGNTTKAQKPLTRDARLQRMVEELRVSQGWRWRYRSPWLLLSGTDALIDTVAPGLKRAGVMSVGNAILVHVAPDGIEASVWRRQIRKLRPRRPVDSVVQVTHVDEHDTELPRVLAAIANELGWAAPVTLLHAVPAQGGSAETFEAIGAFQGVAYKGAPAAAALHDQLAAIEHETADAGVRLCTSPARLTYLAEISQYIGKQREHIVTGWQALLASHWLRAPLAGVMFAPVFATTVTMPTPAPITGDGNAAPNAATVTNGPVEFPPQPAALLPTWFEVATRQGHGRRMGFYWPDALAMCATLASIAWCVWMTASFIGNQPLMREARATANAAVDARPQTAAAWRAQLALQQLMEKLEYRQQHGAPWYLRAGLSRNDDILDGLWQPYRIAATRNLQIPIVQTIGGLLNAAGQARADSLQSQETRGSTYNALKTYLMLGDPSRADPAFLKRLLIALWPRPVEMPLGERDDTGRRLAAFYADHLKAHPEWRIPTDDRVVTSTRNMLVTQMGLASADDTVYRSILDDVKSKYADASLETLLNGADAHGMFTASQTVPGIYTRAAWDGMIAAAIDKASREGRVGSDWVLTGSQASQTIGITFAQGKIRTKSIVDEKRAAEELKQRLTARYFGEYAAAWQRMLNSMQWQPASNLNGAVEQLSRLVDAQTSPLLALMKSVQFQAQAGRPSQALTDTLVRKAQDLIGADEQAGAAVVNPLDKPFGPLLVLMGDTGASPTAENGKSGAPANIALNGVSLSRYLTAVTTMRLKLQQISGSPDAQAMARSLAQAVFQGKLSELSQARDDAALTAASLGTAWAGFGDAVLARPLEAAWQTILQPAAASLNDAWRASVAAPFNAAMSSRYPFVDTQADASFAELGRYVRPDTGLISRFITTQLAGVMRLEGDHWTPNELAPQALQFDPKFLTGVRQLSTVGAQLYLQGDAGEKFEMMALPTPNVTRSELSVDGKQIVYFNQQERWTSLAWPGNGLNGHAGLTWQTLDAGLRQAFDSTGDWAFLRLLSRADVKQLDSTRYQLTWNTGNGEPLSYVLRTQVGAGPLDLLKLRGFRMPDRIFVVGKAGVTSAMPLLPPLPPELQP
ncbi:type VI secretion protein VasK [Burkholderia stagnalis]|uniref:ImcF-related family protein n=1 Tax=Burkholderia stagnalis TaxID=1503054 RepID=UPI0007553319|nr:ImcF-related family protein [Burkholderia stagnalis]KVO49288.1 type VI secretion protein VasK [Burkholderia stagnalis]KVO80122.1 type VI secretion protein VasK [Burkholderia stagnalis]KVW66500.1 type VI secretion protein VasK [Burkholderia stagnalis]KVW86756.1 type VI secretion protein VasK [Burkholderia stagnalis]KVX78254.1 type VI secretion protein VasK [Burkholderia stagnalis]